MRVYTRKPRKLLRFKNNTEFVNKLLICKLRVYEQAHLHFDVAYR